MNDEEKSRSRLVEELKMLRWLVEDAKSRETEVGRLEKAVKEQQATLGACFDASPDPILLVDPEGRVLAANEAWAARLGRDAHELAGSTLRDLFPRVAAERREHAVREAVFTRRPVHFEDTDGERYYENHAYPIADDTGQVLRLVLCSADVTERKGLEKALAEAELRYRRTSEIISEGLFQTAPDGHFVSANNVLARMFGYASPEDLIRSVVDISRQHYVDPARRSEFIRLLEKDGSVYDFEIQMFRKDGGLIWVSLNARAVRDKNEIVYYEGAIQDITIRKRLEAELVQSQKFGTVGKLTGGIAHKFTNLVTVIMGNLELLLQEMEPAEPDRRKVRAIEDAVGGALKLCDQLHGLGKKQLLRPVDTRLDALVERMDEMLRYLLGEDIALDLPHAPDIPPVKADPSLVEQIILILAQNSREAMPEGGTLTISVDSLHLGEGQDECLIAQPPMGPGEYVALTVSDTGKGIEAAVLEHIFEPFFSIKPDGTGLGLSIVRSIVKQSGGHIRVESAEGRGTTFSIYFPVSPGESPGVERAVFRPDHRAHAAGATVMVVEDESGILYWVTDVLEGMGLTVISAFDAGQAASALAGYEGPVDLLIADLVLPGTPGHELAATLKERYPDMKVIFMSGYLDGRTPEADIRDVPFLSKPFSPLLLRMKVREVLGV